MIHYETQWGEKINTDAFRYIGARAENDRT